MSQLQITMGIRIFLMVTLAFWGHGVWAQDSVRFEEEVKTIVKRNDSLWSASRPTVVFTGSSSIRFWKDLQDRFPEHQVLNAGFGGSEASDLLVFLDDLVLRYQPQQVFIYEGDNDIAAKKSIRKILGTMRNIVARLGANDNIHSIVLISAKPSIARWKYRGKYRRLNKRLKGFSEEMPILDYVDVWTPMLFNGKLNRTLFINDGLHMNAKGYSIWYENIKKFLHR